MVAHMVGERGRGQRASPLAVESARHCGCSVWTEEKVGVGLDHFIISFHSGPDRDEEGHRRVLLAPRARAFVSSSRANECVRVTMSCCDPPPLPFIRMLTLVSGTSPAFQDDDNNNNHKLALKMMAPRGARGPVAAILASALSGPKRCLFGAPSPADTQRLVREDQDAVRSRMARRWGWDLDRGRPHPYHLSERLPSPMTVPAPISPLPATPKAVLNASTTSSSSGTSSLAESPSSSPSWRPDDEDVVDEDSEDSCCGTSASDSSTRSPRAAVPVQTRITDFWRTRRCSTSENIVKPNPGPPTARVSARTCSV